MVHTVLRLPHADGEGQKADDGYLPELDAEQVRFIKSEGMCGVEKARKRNLSDFKRISFSRLVNYKART